MTIVFAFMALLFLVTDFDMKQSEVYSACKVACGYFYVLINLFRTPKLHNICDLHK